MKTWKRTYSGLIAAAMLLSAAGCGSSQPAATTAANTTKAADNNSAADDKPADTTAAPAASSDSDNPLAGTYNIVVWTSEIDGVSDLTKQQIANFCSENPGIVINATVEGVSESESATQMITSVEDGADMYFFAQDQLARLVQAGALAKLGQATSQTVTANNDAGSVAAATVDGQLYCYPVSSDNGYFMIYDKSVVSEDHVDSLEDIIADCEAAGKMFSMDLEGSAWYNAGFFFGTGCKSEWKTDVDGQFISVDDNFNSDKGLIALKGMQKLLQSTAYNSSGSASDFAAGVPSAVVVTGTWDVPTAQELLGDNFGATDLPSFTVDGASYHIGSYSGTKLLGVKPQVDAVKAAVLQQLALYITNENSQLERFRQFGWGPSNLKAQEDPDVQSNVALAALSAQNEYAIPQGNIHGSWWDIGKTYATAAKNASSEDDLKAALQSYADAINGLFNMSDEVKNAFTVIGSMYGDGWSIDYAMTEVESGVWVTDEPITFAVGDEFKVRQGLSWDVAYGTDGGNFVSEVEGSYNVKLTISGDNGTVTLEAA